MINPKAEVRDVHSEIGMRLSVSPVPLAAVVWKGHLMGYRAPDRTDVVYGATLYARKAVRDNDFYHRRRFVAPFEYVRNTAVLRLNPLETREVFTIFEQREGFREPDMLGVGMLNCTGRVEDLKAPRERPQWPVKLEDYSTTHRFDVKSSAIPENDWIDEQLLQRIKRDFLEKKITEIYKRK